MLLLIIQCTILFIIAYAAWSWLRALGTRAGLKNIPGPPSESFIIGNTRQFYDPDGWDFHKQLAENYGSVVKIYGLFGKPQLYVFDPLAMQNILMRDRDIYDETAMFLEINRNLLGMGLISTTGDLHRKQRRIIAPAFSTVHLRRMVPIFYEVAEKVRDTLTTQLHHAPREIEMASWFARTSLELIGRGGLGYSFDAMDEEASPNSYAKSIKNLLPTVFTFSLLLPFLPMAVKIGPPSFRRFLINIIPSRKLREINDMVDLISRTTADILDKKVDALRRGDLDFKEGVDKEMDIMSVLLRANIAAESNMKLSGSELSAQLSTLIFAGLDTTSGALNRVFHLLAQHPQIQEKLRAELLAADEDLNHDKLVALPYLDAVVRESLRLYPPAPSILRVTRTDTVLPLSAPFPGLDGTLVTSIHVPKDTTVVIAIMASNRSRAVWGGDALEWKPERWLDGSAKSVAVKVPGVYSNMMTFLSGGRSCIGFKFSQLEMKVVLFVLLRSFKFSVSDKDVVWRMGGPLPAPTVNGIIQLPPKVEMVL